MMMLDTYSHGFDMPASVQLQRVNRKLNNWDRTQELIEKNKVIEEQRAKSIIVKDDKIQAKIDKNRTMMSKIKDQSWKDKKEKYMGSYHRAKQIKSQIEQETV